MDLENMMLLIEVIDELEKLDNAVRVFNDAGYSDCFDNLNHVYSVIKNYSIFKGCDSDKDEEAYDEILKNVSIPAEDRARILLGLDSHNLKQ